MDKVRQEVDKTRHIVEDLVNANQYEISLIGSVNKNIDSIESTFTEYDSIKATLGKMIQQSSVSKEDIEKMLIVFQDNIVKTGGI